MDYGNLKVPENVTPEVQAILDSYEARNKEIEKAHRKNIGRIWLGSVLSGASAHPVLNIPYVGTGLGGALYDAGQAIVEGDKLPDIAKRAGRGFIIGETVGAIPYAGKYANKLSGGKIGNAFTAGVEKLASTPLGQKVTEIAPKVEDLLMTDIKAFNPLKQTQTAYHGSPYEFNKFSNEAIGTGEQAQAHGWGHYAALNKDVADVNYRQQLAQDLYLDGKKLNETSKEYDMISTFQDYVTSKNPTISEAKEEFIRQQQQYLDKLLGRSDESALRQRKYAQDYIDLANSIDLNNLEVKSGGQLYKLSIPKDDVMLREYASFSEQPVKVQKALTNIQNDEIRKKGFNSIEEVRDRLNTVSDEYEKAIREQAAPFWAWSSTPVSDYQLELSKLERLNNMFDYGGSSKNIYDNLAKQLGDVETTNLLNKHGIKGISYHGGRDGEARVIFNPDDIEIVRKYYNQPELWDKLKGLRPNEGAELLAIENALRNPQFPMNEQDFNAYEDLGLRYYQNIFQPNTIEIPGYGVASFSRKNRGKDDVTNFRMYPDLFELLTGAKPVNRTNYKNELDRQYDYLENPNNKIYQFLMEDIKDKGKRYKMMRNKETGK